MPILIEFFRHFFRANVRFRTLISARSLQAGGDGGLDLLEEFVALVNREARAVDGRAEAQKNLARDNREPAFGHAFAAAENRDRHDGHARLNGHHEGAFFEWQEASISAAMAFGKNKKRNSFEQNADRMVDAGNGGFGIGAIYGNDFSEAQRGAHHGNFEDFLLREVGNATRNSDERGGRIQIADVIRGEDAYAAGNVL